jgi:2-polyprenyl-3-methyl-5-hydroxy-6-metoxy-1,4-benzoquinol methylase
MRGLMGEAKAFYEKLHSQAGVHRRLIGPHHFTYRHILRALRPYVREGSRVLDLGCGNGAVDLYLASLGAHVLGVDISESAIAACRESARVLGLEDRAAFEARDLAREGIEGRFDLILCSEVVEHLPDDAGFVTRLPALLAPGGVLVLSVPSANAPLHRLRRRLFRRDRFDEEAGHLRRYTPGQARELATHAGLEVVEVTRTEGLLRNSLFATRLGRAAVRLVRFWVADAVTLIDNALVPLAGESQIILVARLPA